MVEPLLEIEDCTVQYRTNKGMLTAVSDVSLSIEQGEYFGVVGESGCGKSTLTKAILGGLDKNGEIISGKIRYKGQQIQEMSSDELNKKIRWKEISWIPQGSMSSLDPTKPVKKHALDIAHSHTDLTDTEALEKFQEMFEVVGLQEERMTDYPFQFSGGMQQRVLIALSLFLEPSMIIADEPTTSLDVIMQDNIFKYIEDIKDIGTTLMLITHDISLVYESCDRMAIMHAGQLAEVGTTEDVYAAPHHPYSILLQETYPDIREPNKELSSLGGNPPQLFGDVNSCTFVDRCPWSVEDCSSSAPKLEGVQTNATERPHVVSCFRRNETQELYEDYDN